MKGYNVLVHLSVLSEVHLLNINPQMSHSTNINTVALFFKKEKEYICHLFGTIFKQQQNRQNE